MVILRTSGCKPVWMFGFRVESSRVTTSVTEEGATRHLENISFGEGLKKQPGTEIVLLTIKVELFPEDTPVSTQAVRKYLSLVWEQYKNWVNCQFV